MLVYTRLEAIFVILALIGSLSPLLTLAWLWQVKEWRWDRLLEHLEREGVIAQLFGRVRPVILAGYVVAVTVLWPSRWPVTFALCAFAALALAQIALKKQRRPVMTSKAMLMVTLSIALSAAWALILLNVSIALLPVLPLLMPVVVAVAWAVLLPIDTFLKNRIMKKAEMLRRALPDLTVIGITGSVGKTTTKELIACVLQDLQPLVTPAHVNSEIGVARWMLSQLSPRQGSGQATRNSQRIVIEMGAYRKGEISQLCSFAQPTMGVVTYVGGQHVALFGSEEALAEAKSELIRALPLTGHAFLNGDNQRCREMESLCTCPVTIVGTGGSADLEAFEIEETGRGVRFRVEGTMIEVPLPGTHNVINILLALAAGQQLGIDLLRMRDLLKTFTPLSRTFQVREEAGVRILDDTHNASFASIKAAIAWARTQPEECKILLTSGLIEMGEQQAPSEEELGGYASKVFERVILLSDLSAKNFIAGGAKNVELLSATSAKIPTGALLVCAGRMSSSTIKKILPS